MKKLLGIVLMSTMIIFSVCAKDYIVYPGVGVGNTLINYKFPLDSKRQQYADEGVFLSGSEGVIKSIVITNANYKTKEGIKVGDSLQKVFTIFGYQKKVKVPLLKGNIIIGDIAQVISYEGISFTIKNDYVSAILIKE